MMDLFDNWSSCFSGNLSCPGICVGTIGAIHPDVP